MDNQPIVLCDEDLAVIHGCGPMTQVVEAVVDWVMSKVLDEALIGAEAGLSALNNALGPPGTYNPYSNPINCEYAGYY
jgi:hypothetical protein